MGTHSSQRHVWFSHGVCFKVDIVNKAARVVHVWLPSLRSPVDKSIHCWIWICGNCSLHRAVLLDSRFEERHDNVPCAHRYVGGSPFPHGICGFWSFHCCSHPVCKIGIGVHGPEDQKDTEDQPCCPLDYVLHSILPVVRSSAPAQIAVAVSPPSVLMEDKWAQ